MEKLHTLVSVSGIMKQIDEARAQLDKLRTKSKFEKMLYTTAIITKLVEIDNAIPIIVGGLAVEIYTRSDYTTVDIDLVTSKRTEVVDILEKLGFSKEGRHWFHEDLLISVEIPSDVLEGSYEKKIKLNLPGNLYVYVISIEDIILDRLRACVHWKSSADCEWAERLYRIHYEKLDLDYMNTVTVKDQTNHILKEFII